MNMTHMAMQGQFIRWFTMAPSSALNWALPWLSPRPKRPWRESGRWMLVMRGRGDYEGIVPPSAAGHILPHQHAVAVTVVIPAQGLYLDMLLSILKPMALAVLMS